MEKFKLRYLVDPNKWSDQAAFIIFWISFLFTFVILPLIMFAVWA